MQLTTLDFSIRANSKYTLLHYSTLELLYKGLACPCMVSFVFGKVEEYVKLYL